MSSPATIEMINYGKCLFAVRWYPLSDGAQHTCHRQCVTLAGAAALHFCIFINIRCDKYFNGQSKHRAVASTHTDIPFTSTVFFSYFWVVFNIFLVLLRCTRLMSVLKMHIAQSVTCSVCVCVWRRWVICLFSSQRIFFHHIPHLDAVNILK